MYSSTIFKLCSLVGLVAAHGFMQDVTVDGTKYPGSNGAAANPSKSPIRQLNNDPNDGTPIFDPSSSDMGCGIKSSPVSTVVNVKPGSKIATHWQGPTNIPWFHDTGPVLTYMAACEGSCSTFQPTASTKWFKIDQLTEKQPGTPNTWYQADMNSGAAITVTLPTGLASGGYLYRQEVIALQNGQTKGAAEYYPSCIQMNVVGGASTMNPSPTVNFPGAYSETDPGVFGNFYNPGVVYVAPGGPVATLNGSGKSTASTPSAPPANAAPAPAPPAASKPATAAPSSKPAAAKPAPSSAPAAKAPAAPAPAAPSQAPASSSQCNKRKRSAAAQAAKKSIRSSHFKRRLASTH